MQGVASLYAREPEVSRMSLEREYYDISKKFENVERQARIERREVGAGG